MGKHSIGDERAFWRSAMFFALKWMGVMSLPLLAAWGIWRLLSEPDRSPVSPAVIAEPSPGPPASPPPEASPEPSPSPVPVERGRVQVLNGSGVTGMAQSAADRLREAGFEIEAIGNAAQRYERTTVFYKPGFEEMADQVAEVLGSANVQPAPASLTREIPVTAVVGADFES